MNYKNKLIKTFPVFLCLIVMVTGCSKKEDWSAFVYPDIDNIPKADSAQNYSIGKFQNFEDCQSAAISRVRYNYSVSNTQGDYQCGLNCTKRNELGGMLICEETRK